MRIINDECIGNQHELMTRLSEEGVEVTQATLSRDLKVLHATKVATDKGRYMFIIPNSNDLHDTMLKQRQVNMGSAHPGRVLSLAFSRNIVVIKTRNGYATGLAYDIDMSCRPEILGTIPGADTVMAVLREDVTRTQAEDLFRHLLLEYDIDGLDKF